MGSNQKLPDASENIEVIEKLYDQYLNDPSSVNSFWQEYFKSLETAPSSTSFKEREAKNFSKENQGLLIEGILEAYRTYGHLYAKINPLQLDEPKKTEPEKWAGYDSVDFPLEELFQSQGLLPKETVPLKSIIDALQSIYCKNIGYEFKGLLNLPLEEWIQKQLEDSRSLFRKGLDRDQKRIIFEALNHSEIFETFLHTKYVGQKRFSLEGEETLIPMLKLLIEKAVGVGVTEIVLGMSHRGRLNVLTNILDKSHEQIFDEFEDFLHEDFKGTGDVKYHKGYTSEKLKTLSGQSIKITLPPNPSHLESVDPVVEGAARAKQELHVDTQRSSIIPILIHGDAAISGQGVVYETFQFYKLPGYTTGGTIHFVINNQIGFTTIARDLRSTYYCTDIAKAFNAPVFHVNAEDPEGCVLASLLAFEIRQKFHCDVVIELNGYRKYGHNETDEPAFTQPIEYQIIRKKKPIRELYRDQLIKEGILDKTKVDEIESRFKQRLQDIHQESKKGLDKKSNHKEINHSNNNHLFENFNTGVSKEILLEIAQKFCSIPSDFNIHPKLAHLVQERFNMAKGEKAIDWGMAEFLAYGSLLWEGRHVRISGQDCCRGTFTHRHAVWVDQKTELEYFPLAHLKSDQGKFEIYNSTLSEMAVLAFEYGYSVAYNEGLIIWEAQFGDFSNGAQVIIDQYIASGEQKWGQVSGLVLFLPHGYEGQGPEHSSARLERFLTLAGHQNLQIVYPTSPAQLFHLLRRQTLRSTKKPLVIMTPKGLLRLPSCTNQLSDFTEGYFHEVLDDSVSKKEIKKLIFCSGRIYYDLMELRSKENINDFAVIRIEQLYPLNVDEIKKILNSYDQLKTCLWVQEEHKNMGAWGYISPYLRELLPTHIPLKYVGRDISASPATGSHSIHKQELETILKQVTSHEN